MRFSRRWITFGKFVRSLPVHASYCADCLSELEQVMTQTTTNASRRGQNQRFLHRDRRGAFVKLTDYARGLCS